jgi:c-di-GMP-binding flagellar brake protein YcgR
MESENKPGEQSVERDDRRRESRHPVDGSAVLHLVNIATKMPGRVVDLSLNGCCIRTDARYTLGIYRRVEVELRIEGLPFRLAGVTQSLHDAHRVGIRFLNVSDRKREQLALFIEELGEFLKARRAAKDSEYDPPGPRLVPPPEGQSSGS